jgi:heme oxygenase
MTKNGWTYDLHHELHKVVCVKSRIVAKENKNTYTDLQGVITEYLDCKLSDVPASVDSDWYTWDEY